MWLGILYLVTSVFRSFIIQYMQVTSATNMHNAAVSAVLRSPVTFFDANPSGRINTRFSKDIVVMDFLMSAILNMITIGFFRVGSVTIGVIVQNYFAVVPILLAFLFMYCILRTAQTVMNET